MPTAIGGFTEGLLAGTQVRMAQEQQTEAREQRAWDRNYKQFNSAMQYANKLPAGQRGKFMSNFLNRMGKGTAEFKELSDLYSQADEETMKDVNQTMIELNKAKGSGETPHLQIAKLETLLGKDSPTVVAFKESFKIDVEETSAKRFNEIYDLHEQIAGEASEGGKEVTQGEAAKMLALSKKYPNEFKEARLKWAKDKDAPTTRVAAEEALARRALAAGKGIPEEDVSAAEAFEKVKELRRALPGEAVEKEELTDFAKQIGESDRQMRLNIKSNAVIEAGLQQLEKGIIAGTFAKAELGFKKALAKAGLVNPETKEKITTTEAYAGLMGIRVGQVISLFGAGTGLSDADREFAEKIAAGEIRLDETSLVRLQKMNKQVLIEEAIIHNDMIDEFNLARDDRGLKPSIRKKVDVNRFLPKGDGKQIDEDNAKLFFAASKGDVEEARRLATEKGWKF